MNCCVTMLLPPHCALRMPVVYGGTPTHQRVHRRSWAPDCDGFQHWTRGVCAVPHGTARGTAGLPSRGGDRRGGCVERCMRVRSAKETPFVGPRAASFSVTEPQRAQVISALTLYPCVVVLRQQPLHLEFLRSILLVLVLFHRRRRRRYHLCVLVCSAGPFTSNLSRIICLALLDTQVRCCCSKKSNEKKVSTHRYLCALFQTHKTTY